MTDCYHSGCCHLSNVDNQETIAHCNDYSHSFRLRVEAVATLALRLSLSLQLSYIENHELAYFVCLCHHSLH